MIAKILGGREWSSRQGDVYNAGETYDLGFGAAGSE